MKAKIQWLSRALGTRPDIDMATKVVFANKHAFTFDGELVARAPMDYPVEMEGRSVDGRLLLSMLSLHPGAELLYKDNALVLKSKKTRAQIQIEDVPLAEEISNLFSTKKAVPVPEGFSTAVKRCASTASSDITKPILNFIHCKEGAIESCDDFSATRIVNKNYNITCFIYKRLADGLSDFDPKRVVVMEGWVVFHGDNGLCVAVRSITEEYPDLTAIFDGGSEIGLVTIPESAKKSVADAMVFSNVADNSDCKITLGEGTMQIVVTSPMGEFKSKHQIDNKKIALAFRTNLPALKNIMETSAELHVLPNKVMSKSHGVRYVVSTMPGE